jgi:hypothetical protein
VGVTGSKTNAPLLPWLSRHVPDSPGSSTIVCPIATPAGLTTVRLRPIVPSGLKNAVPTAPTGLPVVVGAGHVEDPPPPPLVWTLQNGANRN